MADSDNKGHPGWTIGLVHGAWKESQWMMPNLVLINAGLNDCNPGDDPSKAGERTKALVDDIFDNVPGVTVILCTLLRNGDADRDACSKDISRQIRSVAKGYKKGTRIGLADVGDVIKMSDIVPDKDHPTDEGYKFFARVWWDAISQIEDRIQPPAAVSGLKIQPLASLSSAKRLLETQACWAKLSSGVVTMMATMSIRALHGGTLESAVIDKGSDPKSITNNIPWHIFVANIVKGDPNAPRTDSLDDWIRVYHNTKDRDAYWFRQNMGGGKFDKSVQFYVDMNCNLGPRYAFANLNKDGLDDFFCIKENSVWDSLNRGGSPPKFESIGDEIVDVDLPEKGANTDKICKWSFDSEDEDKDFESCTKSGAAKWFKDWLYKNDADKWTDKFFKAVIGGSSQGGSTMNCKNLGSTTCQGPGTTPCSYIKQLAGGIKEIVDEYGEPLKDDRAMMLNMLVGILTSAAGLGAKSTSAAGTLTFFSGAFASASANSGEFPTGVSKDDLADDLVNAYGTVFNEVLNVTTGYVEAVLLGSKFDNIKGSAEDRVHNVFSHGQWLSEPYVTEGMKTYIEGTHKKWESI
ncbi:hypothetical protein FVEN_g6847 [Fusarium venenatum]|nr:hypothetical protein FVEN_g6847 [Fusarium venenatum]